MVANTKKAAVFGYPVKHSRSPKLHNYWFNQLGIPGEYSAMEITPDNLRPALQGLKARGFSGVNLTIPHKEAALAILDRVDPGAKIIGAVNTVIVKDDGTLMGINTDAYGFLENICDHTEIEHKGKAVVLGAGGAARAIAYALKQEGFRNVVITNRSAEKAEALAKQFGCTTAPWESRSELCKSTDLLVNTTSLGMTGNPALEIDLSELPEHAIVNDIVYAPLVTPLLKAAEARGNIAIGGLGMLAHQGAKAFQAWFGVLPPVTQKLLDMLAADA